MAAYHPDAGRLAKTALAKTALDGQDGPTSRHLACEILALLPLLRAVARVRSAVEAEAEALARATVRQALAEPPERVPSADLRPWLLGVQRAIHAAGGPGREVREAVTDLPPARGANATWHHLHQALLRLPDRQREVLVLADGAYCAPAELAAILGCGVGQACRRVRHARAALLARLAAAQRQKFPPARSSCLRRPPGRHPRPRQRGGQRLDSAPLHRPGDGQDERQAFARRLNEALFRVLWHDAADPVARRGLEALMGRQAPADGGTYRTSWLRLMFIAYASSGTGASES